MCAIIRCKDSWDFNQTGVQYHRRRVRYCASLLFCCIENVFFLYIFFYFFLFLVTSLFSNLLHIYVNALCLREWISTNCTRPRQLCPTDRSASATQSANPSIDLPLSSPSWIIVAVTATIAAYLQATSTRAPIAYHTRRGIYRGTMLLCGGLDWRTFDVVRRWSLTGFCKQAWWDQRERKTEREREIIRTQTVRNSTSHRRRKKISYILFKSYTI